MLHATAPCWHRCRTTETWARRAQSLAHRVMRGTQVTTLDRLFWGDIIRFTYLLVLGGITGDWTQDVHPACSAWALPLELYTLPRWGTILEILFFQKQLLWNKSLVGEGFLNFCNRLDVACSIRPTSPRSWITSVQCLLTCFRVVSNGGSSCPFQCYF